VPVVVVFSCEICGARPDRETQRALEHQLLDLRHGEYVDAGPADAGADPAGADSGADPGPAASTPPAPWLTWHGRGMYGPVRYACGEHRGELKALVRQHYGTLGWHPWARGPHPWAGRRGSDRARALARRLRSSHGR
jgi:hypothetical protein